MLRTDDLIAYSTAIRAGLGIGFMSNYMEQADSHLKPRLPMLKIPPLPLWLVVHRELRGNQRIKAVYEFIGAHLPQHL